MTSGERHVPKWTCLRSALQESRWRLTPSAMLESRSCEMCPTVLSANGWSVSFVIVLAAAVLKRGQGMVGGLNLYQRSWLGPSRGRA